MQSTSGEPGKLESPNGIEPETHGGEYSSEWAELRRLHRKLLKVAVAAIAILGLISVANSLRGVGVFLFVAWVIVLITLFSTLMNLSYWACPRCGKPFHYSHRTFGNINNPFAGQCIHCGLPKWAESDPDPKLKHDLDPFRTDQIFKLGDMEARK
jgi:hypothetical protein